MSIIENYETKVIAGYFYQIDTIEIPIDVYFDVDEIILKNFVMYDVAPDVALTDGANMGILVFRSGLFDDKAFYATSYKSIANNPASWVTNQIESPDPLRNEQRYKLPNRRPIRGTYRFYINGIDTNGNLIPPPDPTDLIIQIAITFEFRKYKMT